MLRFEALPMLQKQLLAIDLQVLASNLSPKCRHKHPKGIRVQLQLKLPTAGVFL